MQSWKAERNRKKSWKTERKRKYEVGMRNANEKRKS